MLRTFIQILFFIMLFFIAFKAYNSLMSFWVKDLEQGTIKSMEGLKVEIDNMIKEEAFVPIYVDLRHQIKGFRVPPDIRFCKGNSSCLCICSLNSSCENNAIKRCLSLDSRLAEDFSCEPKKDDESDKSKVYDAILSKKKDKVSVSC